MAQTSLLAIQDQTAYTGAQVYQKKFTITLADFIAIGANLTGDVLLVNLPPKAFVTRVFTKHQAILAGPSLSAATVVVKTATNATLGGAAFNVFQAAGATVSQLTYPAALKEADITLVTPLLAGVTLTGCNANALTAAVVDIWVTYEVIP